MDGKGGIFYFFNVYFAEVSWSKNNYALYAYIDYIICLKHILFFYKMGRLSFFGVQKILHKKGGLGKFGKCRQGQSVLALLLVVNY